MSNRAPTILQVVPELDTGGAELSTLEVAEAIVRAGGRALVASAGGRLAGQLAEVGGEIVTMPLASKNPLTLLRNGIALARLIKSADVDLIHARSRAPAWSAALAIRHVKRPFVTTYHGAYGETGPLKKRYNAIMASGDIVIANSNWTAELIKARYDTSDERLVVIPRGVDLARFDRSAISAERITAIRAEWGVDDGARIVLHPARLTRWKGQSVVLDAARALKDTGAWQDLALVFAGDDQGRTDYATALKATAQAYGIADQVRFVGHVSDMPAAFAASAVALVASIEPEAFGRTAAEAQAVGTPVIATALGAPQETVLAPPQVPDQAATGRLVAPGDAGALAQAIGDVLALDDAARTALAARAQAHVRASFSVHGLQVATLGVYDRLIGSALQPRFEAAVRTPASV